MSEVFLGDLSKEKPSKEFKISVPFASIWDGVVVVTTNAKVNIHTGEITDIEPANIEGLETCEREYIVMNDTEIEVYTDRNGYDYWADLKNENM